MMEGSISTSTARVDTAKVTSAVTVISICPQVINIRHFVYRAEHSQIRAFTYWALKRAGELALLSGQ